MEDSSSIVLFANFDSANMARYERVYRNTQATSNTTQSSTNNTTNKNNTQANTTTNNNNSTIGSNNSTSAMNTGTDAAQENTDSKNNNNNPQPPQQRYDVEFNVWTKTDCEGTPGANANRTWFYFGVRGGHGKWIKFNLMNLNKQGRLFEMGMLPVFKTVPGHEKWSRILSKPTWQNADMNFTMSFVHRLPDRRDSVSYFAFCFPHSYEECQQMLEKYDQEFNYCKYLTPDKCDADSIYYHRELFCYSLDKRRIDLLTISSCNNINFTREPRFDPDNLFPCAESKRCYKFDKKRVFVLTSRVHPGETPASFVFNGFLEFILRRDDPRARALRRHFVFKLIPMLNPDGVARGHYRTDQLGINLNRVYLDPSFQLHPSIYAVKSLVVYHHISNRTSKEHDGLKYDHIFKLKYEMDEQSEAPVKQNTDFLTDEPTEIYSKTPNKISDISEEVLISARNNNKNLEDLLISPSSSSSASSASSASNISTSQTLKNSLSNLGKSDSVPQARQKQSKSLTSSYANDVDINQLSKSLDSKKLKSIRSEIISNQTSTSPRINEKFRLNSKSLDFMSKMYMKTKNSSIEPKGNIYSNDKSDDDEIDDVLNKIKREKRIGNENSDEDDFTDATIKYNPNSIGSSNSPHLNDSKLSLINPLWSGIAFYVDLHGHAAKRGCFIYGNSIDNELYQVENVLFAKLISFSSQHFDFDGCNFSIKNMYMKDKREGLSKEGSGRVAIFKTLGIIHSYTLECCYASGRVMNSIAPAINSGLNFASGNNRNGGNNGQANGTISPPLHTDLPPKFTIEHYADVGKAVAIAALDIIEMNPFTRIPNTSFGSLEAVRNWIKFYIRSRNGGGITNTSSTNINITAQNSSITSANQANRQPPIGKYKNTKLNNIETRSNASKRVPDPKIKPASLRKNSSCLGSIIQTEDSGNKSAGKTETRQQRYSLGALNTENQSTQIKKPKGVVSPATQNYKSNFNNLIFSNSGNNLSSAGTNNSTTNLSSAISISKNNSKKLKEMETASSLRVRTNISAKKLLAKTGIKNETSKINESSDHVTELESTNNSDVNSVWFNLNENEDLSIAETPVIGSRTRKQQQLQQQQIKLNMRKLLPINKASVLSDSNNSNNPSIIFFNKLSSGILSKSTSNTSSTSNILNNKIKASNVLLNFNYDLKLNNNSNNNNINNREIVNSASTGAASTGGILALAIPSSLSSSSSNLSQNKKIISMTAASSAIRSIYANNETTEKFTTSNSNLNINTEQAAPAQQLVLANLNKYLTCNEDDEKIYIRNESSNLTDQLETTSQTINMEKQSSSANNSATSLIQTAPTASVSVLSFVRPSSIIRKTQSVLFPKEISTKFKKE